MYTSYITRRRDDFNPQITALRNKKFVENGIAKTELSEHPYVVEELPDINEDLPKNKWFGANLTETFDLWKSTIQQTLIVFFFYLFGVVFYTQSEKWSVLDSIYYITSTITTIGYGDLEPLSNRNSKGFTIFYTVLLGLTLVYAIVSVN